ncbi:hypothetical protein [Myxococcus sp. RHSTA-1-4]|uniref:hypothetical protein n=1 Tax=Myxococcus sp. RHSTA-1-4 TaxID=2874601 RepID=UPI001CBFF351|nr:hypothetical protein [Myxococcus sp. RHSTA-1-4]MBZ4416717.1 hypothetical protein [Myxococcus sp. RHSTA-1-4]
MIRIARGAEPRGLKTAARRRLEAAVRVFNAHGGPSEALTAMLDGYNARATKLALYKAQHEKCAWCERETDFSSSPVEHYRPKDGAWRHLPGEKGRVDAGHYWWLTWTWSNLLFSCARCNDAGHKANYFPLRAGTGPAAVPAAPVPLPPPEPLAGVSAEHPLLIDPAGGEDPLDHITWVPTSKSFDRRDWIWTPLGLTDEGDATIAVLKLGELADRAQGHVRTKLLPSVEEMEEHLSAGRVQSAHRRWTRLLEDNLAPAAPLSAFTWHALHYLVPAAYRRQHGLADPTRPGAPRGAGR